MQNIPVTKLSSMHCRVLRTTILSIAISLGCVSSADAGETSLGLHAACGLARTHWVLPNRYGFECGLGGEFRTGKLSITGALFQNSGPIFEPPVYLRVVAGIHEQYFAAKLGIVVANFSHFPDVKPILVPYSLRLGPIGRHVLIEAHSGFFTGAMWQYPATNMLYPLGSIGAQHGFGPLLSDGEERIAAGLSFAPSGWSGIAYGIVRFENWFVAANGAYAFRPQFTDVGLTAHIAFGIRSSPRLMR